MGEASAEALRQLDATRQQLERDLTVLAERLPQPDQLTRTAAIAGGAAATVAVGTAVLSARRRNAKRDREALHYARINAAALAEAFKSAAEPVEARLLEPRSSRTGPIGLVVAAVALVAGLVTLLQRRPELAPGPVGEWLTGNGHRRTQPRETVIGS